MAHPLLCIISTYFSSGLDLGGIKNFTFFVIVGVVSVLYERNTQKFPAFVASGLHGFF